MCVECFRVSKCCFCFSLKTGSLIIGYITLIYNLLSIAIWSTILAFVIKVTNNSDEGDEEIMSRHKTSLEIYIEYSLRIVVLLIGCGLSITLLVGVCKEKHYLLKVYYVAAAVNLTFYSLTMISAALYEGYLVTLMQVFMVGVNIYFLLIVWSAYEELKERSQPPPYQEELTTLHS